MASAHSVHKILLVWNLLLCPISVCISQSGRGPEATQNVSIGVHFYNGARVPNAELFAAQKVAQRVLQRAGVEVTWQDCTVSQSPSWVPPECAARLRRTDLVLYLVVRLEAHAPSVGKNALGFSIIPDKSVEAQMAYVCYPRVRVLSHSTSFTADELLGLAIAHEIGHLLLGTNKHSSQGIMRARWRPSDLEGRHWEEFLFTAEQAMRLQRGLATRLESQKHGFALEIPKG
jgi:hypothetical protein